MPNIVYFLQMTHSLVIVKSTFINQDVNITPKLLKTNVIQQINTNDDEAIHRR